MALNFSSPTDFSEANNNSQSIIRQAKLNDIWTSDDLNRCIKFIREKFLHRICLQFSDEIVSLAVTIEEQLKKHIDASIFILADTSYGSCCVDEVAAAHVNADSIIHFGHACLSKTTRLPVLYIFPKNQVDVDAFTSEFSAAFPDKNEKIFIFYDVGAYHSIDSIANRLHQLSYVNLDIGKLAENEEPDILCWSLKNNQTTENYKCVYIGADNQSLFNILMGIKSRKWFLFDINSLKIREVEPLNTKFMMRRSHFIEKCKDAQCIGIVAATLTTKGYLDIIKHIQELAKKRRVKTYIFSVGKINTAKLANFSDVDCFVLVGCSENDLYNSRDFYKPLISVFEVEMALNPAWQNSFPETYSTDFREVLPEGKLHKSSNDFTNSMDVSLVTGKVRSFRIEDEEEEVGAVGGEGILMESRNNQVCEIESLQKFQDRTFRGLETRLGQDSPSKVEKGRRGIAMHYEEGD
jgi:diphthamide biosynthesis protein 2